MIVVLLAAACLVWYLFILVVCTIGIFQMYSFLSRRSLDTILICHQTTEQHDKALS